MQTWPSSLSHKASVFEPQLSLEQSLTLLQLITTAVPARGYKKKKKKAFTFPGQLEEPGQGTSLGWYSVIFLNPGFFRACLFSLSALIPCHLPGGAETKGLIQSLPCRHPQESPVRK